MAEISPSELENRNEIAENAVLHSTVSETDRGKGSVQLCAPFADARRRAGSCSHDSGAHPQRPRRKRRGFFPPRPPLPVPFILKLRLPMPALPPPRPARYIRRKQALPRRAGAHGARKAKQQKFVFENAVYKGSLFNTYLIYEEGDNAYIIDQHAAHERLIFDRLKAEMEVRKVVSQPMLVPYILTLTAKRGRFSPSILKPSARSASTLRNTAAAASKFPPCPSICRTSTFPPFSPTCWRKWGLSAPSNFPNSAR